MAGSMRLRSHTPMSQSEAEGALGPLEQPDSKIVLLLVCQCVGLSYSVKHRKMASVGQNFKHSRVFLHIRVKNVCSKVSATFNFPILFDLENLRTFSLVDEA